MSSRSGSLPKPTPEQRASVVAELRVVADTIETHRERVAALATPFLAGEEEDVVIAIHEAERQLLIATRTLRRTIKTLDR